MRITTKYLLIVFYFTWLILNINKNSNAQMGVINRAEGIASSFSQGSKITIDSFQERSYKTDSASISYSFLNSRVKYVIDSSVNNLNERLYMPRHYSSLGNDGNPYFSLVYEPNNTIGWSNGMRSFDNLLFTEKNVRIYNSNFPYSKLGYLFGSNETQLINFLYTHNISSRFLFGGEVKNFSSPGFYKNQNSFHLNYYAYAKYESVNKFYELLFLLVDNTALSSENGGVINPSIITDNDDEAYYERSNVPVFLGNEIPFSKNILSNKIQVGNKQQFGTKLISQTITFGKTKKLRVIDNNDTIYKFYKIPKLLVKHSIKSIVSNLEYIDLRLNENKEYYSIKYPIIYNYMSQLTKPLDSLHVKDSFYNILNSISFEYFSDSTLKNSTKLSINYLYSKSSNKNVRQNITSYTNNNLEFNISNNQFFKNKYKIFVEFSYYLFGIKNGDAITDCNYLFNTKIESLDKKTNLSFFVSSSNQQYYSFHKSGFYIDTINKTFKNENTISLTASKVIFNNYEIKFSNTSIKNFIYYTDYELPRSNKNWINLTQFYVNSIFSIDQKWFWELNLCYQPDFNLLSGINNKKYIPLPTFWTFNKFFFQTVIQKNMLLSTGTEIIYNSPYKAPNYSPVISKLVVQDSINISNIPSINLFLNFRIKGFYLYYKMDNIQTIVYRNDNIYYTRNNFALSNYPINELSYKLGVFWNLVN